MPKRTNNGQNHGADSRRKKSRHLSAQDLFALRDFTQHALSSPPNYPDNPLPLAKLIEQSPQAYRHAVELLAQGNSPAAVAAATDLPVETLRCMSHFIPDYRSIVRDATARNLSQASLRMSEILAQQADRMPPDKLAFSLAVSVEKAELLSGGVTARTEHRNVPTPEELLAMFNALPKAKATVVEEKIFELPPNDLNSS